MNNVIITSLGLQKLAAATLDTPLQLEKFEVSDLAVDFTNLSADFEGEKYKTFINSQYSNANNITLECVISGTVVIDEGFHIRSLGIFDAVGDLIIVAKVPEVYRPAFIEGQVLSENIFNIVVTLENTGSITVKVNEQIFATSDSVQRESANRQRGDDNIKILISQKELESVGRDEFLQQNMNYYNPNKWERNYIKLETAAWQQNYAHNLEANKINTVWLKYKDKTNTQRLLVDFKIPARTTYILDLWVDLEMLTNVTDINGIAEYQARISCSNEYGEISAFSLTNMFKSNTHNQIYPSNNFGVMMDYYNVKRIHPILFGEKQSGILFNYRALILEGDNT
ncbi:Phage tail protein [Candidatus Hepatincolaceae symbiont of Richtersius coronifer]